MGRPDFSIHIVTILSKNAFYEIFAKKSHVERSLYNTNFFTSEITHQSKPLKFFNKFDTTSDILF